MQEVRSGWRITYQIPDDHSQLDIPASARSAEQGA